MAITGSGARDQLGELPSSAKTTTHWKKRLISMQQTTGSILKAIELTKQVSSPEGELTILDNVSLEVPHGQTLAVVGASGAGKSTLLALLAGLDEPTSGQVWLGGTELTALDEDGRAALRNRQVGFVFQSFHLLPALTALENVLLPLELANEPDARDKAIEVLRQVGLDARMGHYPRQLSGGEKQRVAIGRAYVGGPQLFFADEPTGNLDRATGEKIMELLFRLNDASGTTLILVTHDQNIAERCQRCVVVDGGRLVKDAMGALA